MKKVTFLLLFATVLATVVLGGEIVHVNVYLKAVLFSTMLYLCYRLAKLNPEDIGLTKPTKQTAAWCGLLMFVVFGLLGAAYLVSSDVFLDSRYNKAFYDALFATFVALPLTTVLLEEVAFRGILLGYLLKFDTKRTALIVSSIAFGFWHVISAGYISVVALPLLPHPPKLLISLAIMVATGIAGWMLSLLRLKTNNLLVPVVAHWSINAAGMLYAWLAWHS